MDAHSFGDRVAKSSRVVCWERHPGPDPGPRPDVGGRPVRLAQVDVFTSDL